MNSSSVKQAVILVGGVASRLGEIAATTPKPLLYIGDKPFLEHLLDRCGRASLRHVLLLAGHLHDRLEDFAARFNEVQSALTVEVIIEPAPLGTAGALRNAADRLDDVFFMMNGDSLFDCDWNKLGNALTKNDIGAIALRRVDNSDRYGSVDLVNGKIVRFREKANLGDTSLINGGVYMLRRSITENIGLNFQSLETDVFPVLCHDRLIAGVELQGNFVDIGVPEDLERAQTLIPRWNAGQIS